MRFFHLLPLAAASSAFVLPNEQMTEQLALESSKPSDSFVDRLPSKDEIFRGVEHAFSSGAETAQNALDDAFDLAAAVGERAEKKFQCAESMTSFDAEAWLESATDVPLMDDDLYVTMDAGADRPHHGHRKHHHHKPNLTIYELISKSKYTTKLAKLISEDEDLVKVLNHTGANFTAFVPTDKAFDKIPKHGHEPSKELIKKVLLYHISPDFFPAGRALVSHTIPTLLKSDALGGEPQRLRLGLGLTGLKVNFDSRVIAVNIFATNGVIHAVDSVLLPAPSAAKVLEKLPNSFSTLVLGLTKTGLLDAIEVGPRSGGTIFAPDNFAFKKLGTRINAFLFSKIGEKYLKALLEYHLVANYTLYSDAFYSPSDVEKGHHGHGIPKGSFHVDLPTALKDRHLSIDVFRFGGYISMKINGFSKVVVQDGVVEDGVIQVVNNVLIPPKKVGSHESALYDGGELELEDLLERLAPFVVDPTDEL